MLRMAVGETGNLVALMDHLSWRSDTGENDTYEEMSEVLA